jgi:trans-2-enoyl-CoA reductase
MRTCSEGGTLVTYGAMSHEPVVIPSSLFIFNDIQLKGFWMYRWLQQHSAAERAQMMDSIVSLIRTKKLTFNFESWKLEQLERALQRYAEPQIGRKLVLTMGDTQ